MEMQFFGEPWDAPVCTPPDGVDQAPTPVGQKCFAHGCGKPIKEGDRGFLIPYVPYEAEPSLEAWHRWCFMKEVTGVKLKED